MMNRLLIVAFLMMVALVVVSCASKKKVVASSSLQGEWIILKVNGESVNTENEAFIGFDLSKKMIYGNSGCNNFHAQLNLDSTKQGAMSFGEIASTRMMCRDMQQEQTIIKALYDVAGYEEMPESANMLSLNNKDGKQIIILKKK